MHGRVVRAVVALAVGGSLTAQGPAKDSEAVAWVAAYQKAGGVAELTTGPGEVPSLAIHKRKGQKPLVSLKGFGPAPGVRSATLQGYEVSDEDLVTLAAWRDLEQVEVVDGAKVTDVGVKAIAKLPKLRWLGLHDTGVTGDGPTAFAKHDALTHLSITNTTVKGRVRSLELKDLPKLETITLVGEGITRVVLARLPQLRQAGDFPRSLEVADLSGLGRVKDLDFGHTRLKALLISDLPVLETLDLRDTQVPEGAVKVLRNTYPAVEVRR